MERGAILGGYNSAAMNAGYGAECQKVRDREIPRYADELDKWLACIQSALEELESALGGVLRSVPPAPTPGATACQSASTSVGQRLQQFADRADMAHSRIQNITSRLEL
jgi:hypothetical protein